MKCPGLWTVSQDTSPASELWVLKGSCTFKSSVCRLTTPMTVRLSFRLSFLISFPNSNWWLCHFWPTGGHVVVQYPHLRTLTYPHTRRCWWRTWGTELGTTMRSQPLTSPILPCPLSNYKTRIFIIPVCGSFKEFILLQKLSV